MRIKSLVALQFWILENDAITSKPKIGKRVLLKIISQLLQRPTKVLARLKHSMSDHKDDPPPPPPSTTGQNTSGTATTAVYSYVPSNFPIPAPMVCKGNLVANWEFFRQQWEDYEVATVLDN